MKNWTVKTLLVAFSCICLTTVAGAQVGISGSFKSLQAPDYEALKNASPYPATGYGVAVDYWFRVKKRRIEFTPELSFTDVNASNSINRVDHQILAFHFNTNIYPFDLKSDCDCPTWSKDGNFVTKGLFLQVSPGVMAIETDLATEDANLEATEFGWGIGLGAGLDIGLSDFLTVSPTVRFSFYPDAGLGPDIAADLRLFQAGLRVGFRWDELNKYGYRGR